jgi:nicotinamide riboside kinase
MSLFKICLLGAESTGKSTLAQGLASALRERGCWAQATPEALRRFCERYRRLPVMADEPVIFKAQQRSERALATLPNAPPTFLICDSSPLLTAFTSHWYFGDETLFLAGFAHQKTYLHSYLSEPSLPWEPDGIQRDGPETRTRFHADLKNFLNQHAVPYEAVALKPDAVSKSSAQARVMADQLLAKAGLPPRR